MAIVLGNAAVSFVLTDIDAREIAVASTLSLERANALMLKLDAIGIASRKEREC